MGAVQNPPSPGDGLAIATWGLGKRFGPVDALKDINLAVPAGSVLALLGHNGAGKTTLVRILATLLRPDRGTAKVAGWDVATETLNVRASIGLTGQFVALDPTLSARENLILIGRLGRLDRRTVRQRASELIEKLGLSEVADRRVQGYSGGMRRRLDLAASLMTRPIVLFLDEPTTGLDPASRLALWELVEGLRSEGTTVLLTTQYLEEADHLADEICVLHEGVVMTRGTASQLKSRHGGAVVEVSLSWPRDTWRAAQIVAGVMGIGADLVRSDSERAKVSASTQGGPHLLARILDALDAQAIAVLGAALRPPTLDEVFLGLTGPGNQASKSSPRPAVSLRGAIRCPDEPSS